MNVTSLELCKELYELSGWDDPDLTNYYEGTGIFPTAVCPLYHLGYLLRKLQDNDLTVIMRWNRDMGGRVAMKQWDKKWCIGTFDMPQGEYPVADTPEDAAAKLTIELFKQGILTRDDS